MGSARSEYVVLADASELLSDPTLLERWLAACEPSSPWRLHVSATPREAARLARRASHPFGACCLSIADPAADEANATSAIAWYSRRPKPGPIRPLPRYDDSELGSLRRYVQAVTEANRARHTEGSPPDFVGVGVQKAGTTWWAAMLAEHPEVEVPVKERHFFDGMRDVRPADCPVGTYHRLFPSAGSVVGEFTPAYIFRRWIPPLLKSAAPAARLLVMLRDPVERYRSGLTHDLGLGHVLDERRKGEHFERGLYAEQLSNLLAYFAPEQVLVLQYEQCSRDAMAQYRRTLEFLGVSDLGFKPPSAARRVHPTASDKIDLDPAATRSLAAGYLPDLESLAELVPDIDLTLWPTARALVA